VVTDQSGEIQHDAVFIPKPNSLNPLVLGGIAAGLNARGKSAIEIPAALSVIVISLLE